MASKKGFAIDGRKSVRTHFDSEETAPTFASLRSNLHQTVQVPSKSKKMLVEADVTKTNKFCKKNFI